MITTVRARYENGVLTPLEPLDLEEGAEVSVSVSVSVESAPVEASEEAPAPKRGLAGIVERVKELHKAIPPEELDGRPSDGAKNYKHYLYGHPKEEE